MPSRERPVDRGARRAHSDLLRLGAELRQGRVSAGLSLAAVSGAVGISAAHIARIERGLVPTAGVAQIARIGAVVGLDVRVRAYPGPDPLRDAGQLRLIDRFRSHLHPQLRLRLEVPLPIVGDSRAWDAWIDAFAGALGPESLPVEAETRMTDAQAQIRRIMLKARDAGVDHVLIVIADTPANRAAVAAARGLIAGSFPVSPRKALAALAAGRHPGGSALIFI
jgi:transcriptional regulator with XRE-family HTH domain